MAGSELVAGIGVNIKNARDSLSMSMRELARRSGVSYSTISKIEAGRMVPSVVVLLKIARALDKKVAELLDPVLEDQNIVFAPRESRARVRAGSSLETLERVSASSLGWVIEAAERIADPGAKSGRQPMAHRGEEFGYCLEGRVQYVINGNVYDLEPGDAIHFKSHLPHLWKNIHDGRSRLLIVVVPPRRHGG